MVHLSCKNKQNLYKPSVALIPFYLAFVVVTIVIILKGYAYYISGSAALLGSLVDSLGDGAISFITFLTLRYSLRPPDEEHRYGHGKAEGFSALIQASFIFGAAIFLVLETINKFLFPTEITHQVFGIVVSVITILLTMLLVASQKIAYRYAPSLVLKADSKHYTSDLLLNLLVIASLVINLFTNIVIFDLLIGAGIAMFMVFSAYNIAKEATDMLMDKEISKKDRDKIIKIIKSHKDVISMHDLRTRKSGMQIYINFDVQLKSTLPLKEAHDITIELDKAILEVFPNAEIMIHKDPEGLVSDHRHKVKGVHY